MSYRYDDYYRRGPRPHRPPGPPWVGPPRPFPPIIPGPPGPYPPPPPGPRPGCCPGRGPWPWEF